MKLLQLKEKTLQLVIAIIDIVLIRLKNRKTRIYHGCFKHLSYHVLYVINLPKSSKLLDMCESRDKAFEFFIKIMLKSLIGNVFHLRRQFLGNGRVFSLCKRFLRQRSDEDSLCLLRNRWERSWGERKRALG